MGTSMRLILGVVNLLLFLRTCVSTQHCPAGIIPPELDSPESWSVHKPPFDTGFMSSIVHSFLSSVQPNPFPKDLFIQILNSKGITDTTALNEVLRYEVGFLVCVAIGILYIVLMPLIGLCFACCRCCGNCGGYMYQKQTSSINCRRRSFYWVTFLITLLIFAGNICMFLSNNHTHESVRSAPGEFNTTLKNLQSYISNIPKQIDQVVSESFVVVDNVTYNIKEIGPLLGRDIQGGIEGAIMPALDSASVMAQVVQNTSVLLYTLNTTQKELNLLQSNLTGVKSRINKTLHSQGCNQCVSLQSELDKLSLGTSINLSSLSKLQSAVDQAEKTDLNMQIQKGKDFFESIPDKVTDATRDSVKQVQQDLQTIKNQVSQVTSDIPLQQLTEFSNSLSTVQEETKNYTPTIDLAEKLRWIIAIILCCLILLVVMCNLLGLMLGPSGLVPKNDPTDRSSTANCGGLFLMAGVGFSFLFSWIFMIIVLILFLVGGNMYTLICVPWKTQQLFQIIDTPGVIPGFQLSQSLGLKTNLTITNVYNDCQMNNSLWNTLHLEDIINLNDYLNVSKYTGHVQEVLQSSNITLPSIVLLNSETKKQLSSFSATASSVNVSSIMQKVTIPTNLSYLADQLDALVKKQTNDTVKAELQNEAKDLRFIQTQINSTIKPQLMDLASQIELFSDIMSHINGTVENVLEKVNSAQDVLNNTAQTVKSKLTEFVDCQIGVFTTLAEWANQTITEKVGRCGPVAVTVNTVENLVCSQLVDSLNAFWFSLGWCMVFLIPSIIFSVKLAKFYRRMKYKDEYLDNIMMNPIPRVNQKPY
ncbi:prominin-2 [Ictalurus furcatus]|uniref:prominin-2 n=1 Tax=Ictalurus furcatus TaxID=66913 RepID=UPI002350BC39|nr:prominin-2 [Ictalurus furcatus]XP_053477314.1 prominin-2 [Ictalurus furcatus]XP_053477315.1 prominin-2 [Ictalurus furcatus]